MLLESKIKHLKPKINEIKRRDRKIKRSKKNHCKPKDYYKPIKINSAFNNNYIEYQSNRDKDKKLSIEEYLNLIKPYLSNIIYDPKEKWKIQLTMKINFVSTEESNEIHIMYIRSKNIVILTGYETDEIVEELFDSLLQKHHYALENTGEGSGHVFDSTDVLYYKLNKTSLNRDGSYIDSPEWLKK